MLDLENQKIIKSLQNSIGKDAVKSDFKNSKNGATPWLSNTRVYDCYFIYHNIFVYLVNDY